MPFWKRPHPLLDQIFTLDLRSLGVFRIGLGIMLIVDILNRFPNIISHYSDQGALPRQAILQFSTSTHHISVHMLSGHWSLMAFLFCTSIFVSVLLVLGYRTRLMIVIAWLLLISLHARAPVILQAGDVLLRLLLFWGFFLPLGARFSIDSAMSASRDHYSTSRVNGAACAAYLLQISFIYWFGVFLKSGDDWWPDLTAVYYALHLDQFATPFGIWIRQFPGLLSALTLNTLVVESFVPFLWFIPFKQVWLRGFAIVALAGMHMGFVATMHIGQFPFIDVVSLLPIIPGAFWDWVGTKLQTARRTGLRIYYDAQCGFCRRMVLIIRECFLLPQTTVEPASGEIAAFIEQQRSWVVLDHTGKRLLRTAALTEVFACSPVLWPVSYLLRLKPVQGIGDVVYRWIARHRHTLGPALRRILPEPGHIPIQPSKANEIFVLLFLCYVVWWNVSTTQMFSDVKITSQNSWPGQLFRIDQKWSMFAPYPKKDTGWFVIPGKLADGRDVDVFNSRLGKPSFAKPDNVASTYISQRWRKYLMNLTSSDYNDYLLYFGKYICRSWNARNRGDSRLHTFEIYYVRQIIKPDYEFSAPERIMRWRHFCFKKS